MWQFQFYVERELPCGNFGHSAPSTVRNRGEWQRAHRRPSPCSLKASSVAQRAGPSIIEAVEHLARQVVGRSFQFQGSHRFVPWTRIVARAASSSPQAPVEQGFMS